MSYCKTIQLNKAEARTFALFPAKVTYAHMKIERLHEVVASTQTILPLKYESH